MEGRTDELVATIYAALLGETSWQSFLDELNGASPGALSTLFFHDMRANAGAMAYVSGSEGREKALGDYESYYSNLNPWMRKVAVTPIGRGIIGEAIVSRDEFNRSEYYNDYIRRNGLETGLGLTLHRDNACYFLLSTLTDDKDVDRNLARADTLTQIAPHLKRAFRYYRSGEFHAAALDLGEGVGDASGLGLIVVNDDLRVVRASAAGQQVLAAGEPVGLDVMGRIRFQDRDLQTSLQAMFNHGRSGQTTEVTYAPQPGMRFIRFGGSRVLQFFAGPMVAILIGDARGNLKPTLLEVAASHGLSLAETRVFSGIVGGQSITEIARSAGVKRETIRSQLKSIFTKTGTTSQKDIIRLAAGISR
ncbi:DNA-binding CsgD family transcriptional regulator [Mycoplana sp. BE70]|uniref:helix-turn-helix transcriptional regulator n=1 Tax=Mycoplana sp. BE70 TaxID=2817775 RepID=UPI002856A402|nr:helix-turn-helix transcriptional regulator [Mycoplana sp. BE70]MDR6755045.1 DNA-binding CsgD family transcriptional regulator [Mycoplana sp. BE70]